MLKLLSVANFLPYEGIRHAGGKTYNYYIKKLAKDPEIEVSILAFKRASDEIYEDLTQFGIKQEVLVSSGTIKRNITHLFWDCIGSLTTYGKLYSGYKKHEILRYLRKLEKANQMPDVIELQWTEIMLLSTIIKKMYPYLRVVGSEPDVSFLGAERRYLTSKRNQVKLKKRYEILKKLEIEAANCCDLVMPQSKKDADLLISNGVDHSKVLAIVPYYHNMEYVKRECNNHNVFFWGAMGRIENVEACLWFINNVMPLLKDTDVNFYIVGNNPPEEIKSIKNEKIIVTGFVEDETYFFSTSMCMVSPLIHGAGIKVKVLEGLSAGISVLTNNIGIEGIPAENGLHYLHCESAYEYAENIKKLMADNSFRHSIETNAKDFMRNYSMKNSAITYVSAIKDIVD